MFYKNRTESDELKLLRSLNYRIDLPVDVQNYYLSLEKGFKGEIQFDGWSMEFSDRTLILNDLLFEINRNIVQIDSFLIARDTGYIFEVKNLEGDYFIKGDSWHSTSGTGVKNPIHQLNRIETYFPRLLKELGFHIPLKYYVVFVNPEFHLYSAPRELPIVYPTQLNRFKKELRYELRNDSVKSKEANIKYADKLLTFHMNKNPYTRCPKYDFTQLKKGIASNCCHSFDVEVEGRNLVCKKCKRVEHLDSAILRTIDELVLLLPDLKITTNAVYEWCGGMVSLKIIRRVLSANFSIIKKGNSTYFY